MVLDVETVSVNMTVEGEEEEGEEGVKTALSVKLQDQATLVVIVKLQSQSEAVLMTALEDACTGHLFSVSPR